MLINNVDAKNWEGNIIDLWRMSGIADETEESELELVHTIEDADLCLILRVDLDLVGVLLADINRPIASLFEAMPAREIRDVTAKEEINYIHVLMVNKRLQKQGFGRQLLRAFESFCSKDSFTAVGTIGRLGVHGFYEKCGYTKLMYEANGNCHYLKDMMGNEGDVRAMDDELWLEVQY